ncbi:MAG: carbohydrate kinase family protein [Anaerolineae bacterium]|jgi:sulfofructose kinase
MGALDIVGLGLSTLDVLIRLDQFPTWEHGTQLAGFRFDGGGPVGTAMVAAARLGARVGYVGQAGTDRAAELKLESMVAAGVDLSRLVRRLGPEAAVILVAVHANTGERVFSPLNGMRSQQVQPEELDRDYILSAEYLHLDGSHLAAAYEAAGWMQAAGKTVVFDGAKTHGQVSEPIRHLIGRVDVLIGGQGFVPALTGIEDAVQAGRAALALGPRIVVQTAGEQGSWTTTHDDEFASPAFGVDVVDTTGAGDVFHGAYIVGLLHGWGLRDVALFSAAVAAIKCGQLGGRLGIPDLERTLAFLRERGIELPCHGAASPLRRC